MALDGRPEGREVKAAELTRRGDANRALRIADLHVLVAPRPPGRRELAAPVGRSARKVLAAQPRPPHVEGALGRRGDAGPDLPGRGLNGEGIALRPAVAAQVENRLASPVTGQRGLGSVGVEDLQPSDVTALARFGQQEDPVGEDPRVGGAQRSDAGGREGERQRGSLEDEVVVAEGLPLLEEHGGAVYV